MISTLHLDKAINSRPFPLASQFPILSFFTGAGLLDLGFMQAGFPIIWRNEYAPMFIKGFNHAMANMTNGLSKEMINNNKSIIDVSPRQIAKEAFHNTHKPELFGIIGGPPCPDFSVGGKNKGVQGDNGILSQVYVDRILALKPTFFLFENVPGLIRTNRHRLFFDSLIKQLECYYHTDYKLLNALEYGVPQDRQRLFLIGINKKWSNKNLAYHAFSNNKAWFSWPKPVHKDAKKIYNWPDTSPFRDTPEKPKNIPDEIMVGTWICDPAIQLLPNGLEAFRPYSNKFNNILEGDVSRKSFKRLHRWRFSPTAAYGNNEVHLHPFEARRLTVREVMRIQSLPDDYVLPEDMPLSHKFKTIGNGVPVKLANAVANSIADLLGGNINDY